MKAVVVREHGGPEVLRFEDRPDPQPRAGEVLVRVKAVGLNHLDLWVRKGVPGHTFPLPIVPGCDFCGLVESVGAEVAAAPAVPGEPVALRRTSPGRVRPVGRPRHRVHAPGAGRPPGRRARTP